MKSIKFFILVFISLLLTSCGAKRSVDMQKELPTLHPGEKAESITPSPNDSKDVPDAYHYLEEEEEEEEESSFFSTKRIEYAKEFLGTPYKYGGISRSGIDCSGLIHQAFKEEEIVLPRTSREMSQYGVPLELSEVSTGDLLFFTTNPRHNRINHVGLVIEVTEENILFIHSTTSRGVIISSLEESFWQKSLVFARRII